MRPNGLSVTLRRDNIMLDIQRYPITAQRNGTLRVWAFVHAVDVVPNATLMSYDFTNGGNLDL